MRVTRLKRSDGGEYPTVILEIMDKKFLLTPDGAKGLADKLQAAACDCEKHKGDRNG